MKTIAYVSPFVPAEWIAAHGLVPHRLRLGMTSGETLPAARGVCPYVEALLKAVQSGLDATALVLTTVCDPMRYTASLIESRGDCPTFLLNVPSTWQSPAARRFFGEELRRLGRFLIEHGGNAPDGGKLADTMRDFNDRRYGSASENNPTMITANNGIPVALVGGPLMETDVAIHAMIERAGGRVVLDATENGERTQPRPFDAARLAIEPFEELIDAYFDIPDPFRRPNTRFYHWFAAERTARNVRGVILRRYIWCDLWHAELRRVQETAGLPVLELDVGPDDLASPNRLQGRIEAFFETLP